MRSLALGIGLLVSVLGFRSCVGGPLVVSSGTLRPAVDTGSWVWVWKCCRSIEAGGAVWLQWPRSTLDGVYRVVAIGPSTVEVDRSGRVLVDGERIPYREQDGRMVEQYGDRVVSVIPGGPSLPPTVVPSGHVFVLSDARPVGGDSRVHGVVPIEQVRGTLGLVGSF